MRKDTTDALNAVTEDLKALKGDTLQLGLHMGTLASVIDNTEMDLRDCVNELCYQCGKYHHAYEGACIGCRWLEVKEGFR